MNDSLPTSIRPDPILESIFEIRFVPQVPPETVSGLVLAAVRDTLPEMTTLPFAQIPEAVRMQDPNLMYNATHVFRADKFLLKAGSKVLTFSHLQNYPGWSGWWERINILLDRLAQQGIIQTVERVGLRYVNFFQTPILENLNLAVELIGQSVNQYSSLMKFELPDSGILKTLQISNRINLQVEGQNHHGSLVDIDCQQMLGLPASIFFANVETIASQCHVKSKELFFGLLKPVFLEKFNPLYEV